MVDRVTWGGGGQPSHRQRVWATIVRTDELCGHSVLITPGQGAHYRWLQFTRHTGRMALHDRVMPTRCLTGMPTRCLTGQLSLPLTALSCVQWGLTRGPWTLTPP